MIRIIAIGAFALLINVSSLSAAEISTRKQRQQQCIGWMMSNYPSGIQEVSCVSEFSLPSAFLFKCARAERKGYRDKLQRKACSLFFAEAADTARSGYIRN